MILDPVIPVPAIGGGRSGEIACSEFVPKTLPSEWKVYRIKEFSVYDDSANVPKRKRDYYTGDRGVLRAYVEKPGIRDWDVMVNGPFTDYGPSIAVNVHGGKTTGIGNPDTWRRGEIALLSGGRIAICRLTGEYPKVPGQVALADRMKERAKIELEAIRQACGAQPGESLLEFMGGAGVLLDHSSIVSQDDFLKEQGFNDHYVLTDAKKTVIAEKNGRFYALQRDGYSGAPFITRDGREVSTLQEVLCEAGFEKALLMDGAAGYFRAIRSPGDRIKIEQDGQKGPALTPHHLSAQCDVGLEIKGGKIENGSIGCD